MANSVKGDIRSTRLVSGLEPFVKPFSVAAADLVLNDTFTVYQFSQTNCLLWTQAFALRTTDLDTNGTPLISLDVGFGDVDGVIDTAIISTATIGRTGGIVPADTAADEIYDVSGKYLIVDVAAAPATAAAGTITLYGVTTSGING
jgi:hypothetical protein